MIYGWKNHNSVDCEKMKGIPGFGFSGFGFRESGVLYFTLPLPFPLPEILIDKK